MIPTDYAQQRSARYEDMLRTMEWRTFSYRMKAQANFACQLCRQGGEGIELNVHHWSYERDRLPWEYEAHEVAVLCGGEGGCHKRMERGLQAFRRHVWRKLNPSAMDLLNGALTVALDHHEPEEVGHAIANLIASPSAVRRFAHE